MNPDSAPILLVEDSPDDVFFMRHALKKAAIKNPLSVVPDGQAAVDYLSGVGQYTDRGANPLPSLIFLDLKLPFLSGFEVLRWLRQQEHLARIPVVVLTGSSEDRDRDRAVELGAIGYFVKPPEPLMLKQVLSAFSGRTEVGT